MEEVRRWIKFKVIPGWQHNWDPGRRHYLEDNPNVPYILPSIRIGANGHPATRKEVTIAGVWLPDLGILRTLTYHSERDDDYLYEIRNDPHQYGSSRLSDKPGLSISRFSNDLNGILWHFIEDLSLDIQHPMKWLREDENGYVKAAKPEGYGTWA